MQTKTREQIIDTLLEGYRTNYNIATVEGQEDGIVATAEYHVSESGYVLIRSAETWTANSNEYVYFISVPHLTSDLASDYVEFAYRDALEKLDIDHAKHHMCTRAVTVFVCDEIAPEAEAIIRKCNRRKSFMFSLKGWLEVHTIGIVLGQKGLYVISNRYAKDTAEYINELF